jgi:hypothetical protein
MRPSCRRASANLHVPVEQTTVLYKEAPSSSRNSGASNRPTVGNSFTLVPARPGWAVNRSEQVNE